MDAIRRSVDAAKAALAAAQQNASVPRHTASRSPSLEIPLPAEETRTRVASMQEGIYGTRSRTSMTRPCVTH